MKKLSLLIVFISAFKLSFGQVDSTQVNRPLLRVGQEIKVHCQTTTVKNRTYEHQVGETFARTVLANGWFIKLDDGCYKSTWIDAMIDRKFYLGLNGSYKKFNKGKPYSGRIRETDGGYKIMGRCKKGVPYGKFIILNSDNEVIWKGKVYNTTSK